MDGHAGPPRIDLAGDAQSAAERLERGLGEVVIVPAATLEVERGARRSARTTRRRARSAGAAALPARLPRNGRSTTAYGRPPTSIDGRRHGFVHGHGGVAEAVDAGAIAESLGQGGAQDQRHVLHGVVLVDLEVAGRLDLEVEQAVVGERGEQVVEEADPGRDVGSPVPSSSSVTVMSVSRVRARRGRGGRRARGRRAVPRLVMRGLRGAGRVAGHRRSISRRPRSGGRSRRGRGR